LVIENVNDLVVFIYVMHVAGHMSSCS